MDTTKTYTKAHIEFFGSTEHVQQRIDSIQRHISILHKNILENFTEEAKESIKVYASELVRLQKKYSIILKLESHAN